MKNINENQPTYGLPTAIGLVIGIVIGSGIFYKTDDILDSTSGNIQVATLGFLFVGIGVILGALIISLYCQKQQQGGLISFSLRINRFFGYSVGWFLISCFIPALIVILGFVTANYILLLLGIDSFNILMILTAVIISISYISNFYAAKFSGKIQIITTIIKTFPLLAIIVLSFFTQSTADMTNIVASNVENANFLSTLIIIAFIFDGWIMATNISSDLKQSQKNLPRAMIIGTIFITVIYICYFLSITSILGSDQIIAFGDNSINIIFDRLIPGFGSKLFSTFIIISVYSALNGLTMGYLRIFQALGTMDLIKNSKKIGASDSKEGLSITSTAYTLIFVAIYFVIHFISLIPNSYLNNLRFDISLLPMVLIYVIYIVLYLYAIKAFIYKKRSNWYYLVVFFAILNALIIIIGSFATNGLLYLFISLILILIGSIFYKKA